MARFRDNSLVSLLGDELITPVYTPPTRPPWTENDNSICDDDEECGAEGSGSDDDFSSQDRCKHSWFCGEVYVDIIY